MYVCVYMYVYLHVCICKDNELVDWLVTALLWLLLAVRSWSGLGRRAAKSLWLAAQYNANCGLDNYIHTYKQIPNS